MSKWSLNALYNGFNESFREDIEKLKKSVLSLDSLSMSLISKEDLEEWFKADTEFTTLAKKVTAYVSLTLATDTTNSDATKWMSVIQPLFSQTTRPYTLYKKFIINNQSLIKDWLSESDTIKNQEFNIREILESSKYLLDENSEEIISKLKINASTNWTKLQSHLTSMATIEFDSEIHTLSSIRNLAYSPDQDTRKRAYQKELELYKSIEDSVAFALNSIKGEVNIINTLRGYSSPIEATLLDSRMSRETLDSLIRAIEKYLPKFREYFKHKAKLLGHSNGLPWYDLFAPFKTSNPKEYSIEDSKNLIVNSFRTFSEDLAQMAISAYEDKWIDFYPAEGKRGGAFCYNLPSIKQSRILMNYGGSISDIVTLAHELGHAYHGMLIEDLSVLNSHYSMPVAETASTFCENIILNSLVDTVSDEEKLVLIENSLSDLAQITVDILSRYKFETEVFEKRNSNFLQSNELKEIMLNAQLETYGDGLDPEFLHPYMWICKGHYYSAGLSFYNFPYAFGGLFSLGLYSTFQDEGQSFVSKYKELLRATTTATCEDVAMMADIDVKSQAFWESSLEVVSKRIDDFISLTSK